MRRPRGPVAFAFGPIHRCSSNRFPRSVSKTLDLSHCGTVARVHAWASGNGKTMSNDERKSVSESGDAAQNNVWALDGREAMSAMTLSTPGT